MENNVYDRVSDYLTLIGRTELLTCSATQNSFSRIRDQAQQVSSFSSYLNLLGSNGNWKLPFKSSLNPAIFQKMKTLMACFFTVEPRLQFAMCVPFLSRSQAAHSI